MVLLQPLKGHQWGRKLGAHDLRIPGATEVIEASQRKRNAKGMKPTFGVDFCRNSAKLQIFDRSWSCLLEWFAGVGLTVLGKADSRLHPWLGSRGCLVGGIGGRFHASWDSQIVKF